MTGRRTYADGISVQRDVPIYVNYDSFGAYGPRVYSCFGVTATQQFTAAQVRAQVELAIRIWNEVGADVQFQVAGEAPANVDNGCDLSPPNCDAIVISMKGNCLPQGGVGNAQLCGSFVSLAGHINFSVDWNGTPIFDVVTHELGHSLGRLDEYDCMPAENCDTASIMSNHSTTYNVFPPGLRLSPWRRDVTALRADSLYQYGEIVSSGLKMRYSTDGFSSVYSFNEPLLGTPTHQRPGLAFGKEVYRVAAAAAMSAPNGDNAIYTTVGDGVTWAPALNTGALTQSGVSMVFAGTISPVSTPGGVAMFYSNPDNTRSIIYRAKAGTGTSWAAPVDLGDSSIGPPGIGFDPVNKLYVLVWAQRASLPILYARTANRCGNKTTGTYSPCNWSAAIPFAHPDINVMTPLNTPAVDCEAGVAGSPGECIVSYPALSTDLPVIRHVRLFVYPDQNPAFIGFEEVMSNSNNLGSALSSAYSASGTYQHVLSARRSAFSGPLPPGVAEDFIRWNGADWPGSYYPNEPFVTFNSRSPGHLAYGATWYEYAIVFAGN